MKWLLTRLAAALWPHLRPFVEDVVTAHAEGLARLAQQAIEAKAEQSADRRIKAAKKYIGEP